MTLHTPSTRQALRACRDLIQENLDAVLLAHCRIREDGTPDRTTIPDELLPYVRRCDVVLQRATRALGEVP